MSPAFALVISLFLSQSFGLDPVPQPRKSNLFSKYLDKALNSLLEKTAAQNITIQEIDLKDVGRISNVVGSISPNWTKKVDGYQSFGFEVNVNAEKIAVTGDYDFVYLNIPGLLPIFGKGPFSITVDAINLSVLVSSVSNSVEDKFDIDILRLDIVIKNSTVKFDNLMNDPHVADFLNELLSNLIPDLVPLLIQNLIENSKNTIDYYGNGILICIKTYFLKGTVDECIKNLFESKKETLISELSNRLRRG